MWCLEPGKAGHDCPVKQDILSQEKHVRTVHMDTESQAAAKALVKASTTCRLVLAYLRLSPSTDEEGTAATGIHSYRRRRADLKNAGLVRDSGVRRMTDQNCPSAVWEVVEENCAEKDQEGTSERRSPQT